MTFEDFEAVVRKNIADECDVSVEHAQIHITSAQGAIGDGDIEQAKHDLNVAGCLLLALSWDLRS